MDRYNTPVSSQTFKVHVGSVPWTCSEQEIREYFQQFGRVVDLQKKIHNKNARSKGYFILTVDSSQTRQTILEVKHELHSRQIKCSDYLSKREAKVVTEHKNKNRLFLKKIPVEVPIEEVEASVKCFGTIERIYIQKVRKDILEKGVIITWKTVFLEFKMRDSVEAILNTGLKIRGKVIHVEQFDLEYNSHRKGKNGSKSHSPTNLVFMRTEPINHFIKPTNRQYHNSTVYHQTPPGLSTVRFNLMK